MSNLYLVRSFVSLILG